MSNNTDINVHERLNRLTTLLTELGPLAIAVSGGVDSRLLTAMAWRADLDVVALHLTGPHLTPAESSFALQWLTDQGRPYRIINFNPLTLPDAAANARKRCYHCKRAGFKLLLAAAGPGRQLADGSNADDAAVFRPGHLALADLGVASPLAKMGLAKADIRTLAVAIGLVWPEQPSRACLFTRLPYDTPVDTALLARLGTAEDLLESLGFREFRLRLPTKKSARLHLGTGERECWAQQGCRALSSMTELGFTFVLPEFMEQLSGYYDDITRIPDKGK
ncbi:pyridinium-3,5-biscarboxylic acid mononucleotide sulfurtransferase [Desulfovibrionales bacterium]